MTIGLSPAMHAALRDAGHSPGAVVGRGMEGVVVDVGDGLVAKVWHHADLASLQRLQRFHAALRATGPAVLTPRVTDVLEADGQVASVEERLPGRPLRATMDDEVYVVSDVDIGHVLDVLTALAAVPPLPELRVLPVLPGEPPFPSDVAFPSSLAGLVERRVTRHHRTLGPVVESLDEVVAAVTDTLRTFPPSDALVHGDLIPANILVSTEGLAVLDFGFLTTVGDPCFDAAVTASIHDMYGPRHRDNERALDGAIVGHFGYDRRQVSVYRAAYALTTSNVFSASGRDGHFAWCAAILNRPDLRADLGI